MDAETRKRYQKMSTESPQIYTVSGLWGIPPGEWGEIKLPPICGIDQKDLKELLDVEVERNHLQKELKSIASCGCLNGHIPKGESCLTFYADDRAMWCFPCKAKQALEGVS